MVGGCWLLAADCWLRDQGFVESEGPSGGAGAGANYSIVPDNATPDASGFALAAPPIIRAVGNNGPAAPLAVPEPG